MGGTCPFSSSFTLSTPSRMTLISSQCQYCSCHQRMSGSGAIWLEKHQTLTKTGRRSAAWSILRAVGWPMGEVWGTSACGFSSWAPAPGASLWAPSPFQHYKALAVPALLTSTSLCLHHSCPAQHFKRAPIPLSCFPTVKEHKNVLHTH